VRSPLPGVSMPAAEGTRFVPQLGDSKNEGAPGTVSLPTPLPMSVAASTDAEIDGMPDYKYSVNGVVPGYAGHMPRSRDKYAGSAQGGINSDPYSPPERKGPQKGCVRAEDVIPETFEAFKKSRNGIMPGYTGYRPKSHDVFNVTAYGGIPQDFVEGAHERSFDYRRVPAPVPADYREVVGGVLPGYGGFVPNAVEMHGTSHYGKTHPSPSNKVPLAQVGHADQYVTKECNVAFGTMPGYQGHVPQARDSYGTSYHHVQRK